MTSLLLVLATLAPGTDDPPLPSPPASNAPLTPRWDEVLKQRGLCAAPDAQAFQRLPRVTAVKPCESDGDKSEALAASGVWVQEFHQAAHITYPRFGLDGCPLEGDGLLIYEGMRLRVDPNTGLYDLSFTATVPNMPVTLRLQLAFTEKKMKDDPRKDDPRTYKLTLPPIRIEPAKDAKPGDASANTFHIAHRGYSSLFQMKRSGVQAALPRLWCVEPCEAEPRIDCTWNVTRVGVARFGTAVTLDETGR